MKKLSFSLLLSAQALALGGRYDRDEFRDIRWLGRGNTGIATIEDGTAIFYNPAGIAAAKNLTVDMINPFMAGNQSFAQSFTQITHLTSGAQTLSQKFAPFLGVPLGLQGGVIPNIVLPNFAFGYYDYADSLIYYTDPVYPRLVANVRNDYGFFMASGATYKGLISFGASLRYIKRMAIDQQITAGTLATQAASLLSTIREFGEGFGLNLGLQSKVPVSTTTNLAFGLAVEDFGYTRFKNSNRAIVQPATQVMAVNFGTAMVVKIPLAQISVNVDVRRYTDSSLSFSKKLFTGVEFSTFIADLRTGLFQGYWTAGASIHVLPFLDIDLATYGEELGVTAGQVMNRFWMIGIRSGLEVKDKAKSKKQRFKLDNL